MATAIKAPAAGEAVKRPLTVAQAATQWESAKRELERLKPLEEESRAILLEHFEKTKATAYKGRIGLVTTPPRLVLDQTAVREFLGKRLGEFQKRSQPGRSLTLLG